MRLLTPGSTLWLLAHEMRLGWRGPATGAARRRGVFVVAIVCLVLAGTIGLPVALKFANLRIEPTDRIVLGVDLVLMLIFTLMLSMTVTWATQVFYQRGDLDLLLSSPIPARRVLTARCVGMAANAAAFYLLFVTPLILPSVLSWHPEWLSIDAVLISASLMATAVGVSMAMGLFALIGPRATRTLAGVVSALIGVAFYAVSYLGRYLFRDNPDAYGAYFNAVLSTGLFAPNLPTAWPVRALLGDPLAALGLFGLALAVFLIVVGALGARFAADAAAAAGVGAAGRTPVNAKVPHFTGGPYRATVAKELRLMRRDIMLMSQVLLRVFYLIPTAVVLWIQLVKSPESGAPFLAGGVAFIAGQIAGSLAWIGISGEEGLELLASAPVKAQVIRRAKLVAALTPVFWLMLIPVAAFTWISPVVGLATAVGCFASALSSGLICVWYERPAPRTDFRRRRNASLAAALAEFGVGILWAFATGFAAAGGWYAIAPAIIAIIVLGAIQRPQKPFAEVLQAK